MNRFLPAVFGAVLLLVFGVWVSNNYHKTVKDELMSQEFLDRIISQDGKLDPNVDSGIWFNKKISVPNTKLAQLLHTQSVILGDTSGEKWIEVDLTTQHLYAHQGDRIAFDFPISSGLPWTPTVTGEFRIWAKVKSQRMKGGNIANGTYYDLPNVTSVQYFHGGYGLHGAYWHNEFGRPKSHGCVNIRPDNAKMLFDWTTPTLGDKEYALYKIKPEDSVRVVVHGVTPRT